MKTRILWKNKQKHIALLCLIGVFLVILSAFISTASASNQSPSFQPVEFISVPPNSSEIADNSVDVGIWLINIFDYQYTSGTYTADMYVYFFWTNTNITTVNWYFANGYPITPTSVTLIANNTVADVKYQAYRATARLTAPPDAKEFPFDTINVTVAIDLLPRGNDITLNWLTNQTGVDPQFHNSGWKTVSLDLYTSTHNYPLGVQVPKAEMVLIQERQRASTSISPFLAPLIFSLVSAVSFLFSLKEMGAVALRIGLNSSMLVTTLLFSFNVSNGIPPSSSMVLYSIFLLSVLIFMVCNLIVTIIGVVGWFKYKDEKRTKLANKLGFLVSIVVPAVVFLMLFLLR
jgi:hypothetical protein